MECRFIRDHHLFVWCNIDLVIIILGNTVTSSQQDASILDVTHTRNWELVANGVLNTNSKYPRIRIYFKVKG